MAFYGSTYSNQTWNRRQIIPARHIACPQRLKYIHDIKDGYIPYVEDSDYINQSSYRNTSRKTNRWGLYNTTDIWRQELMGLAQRVQSSLLPLDVLQQSRSARLNQSNPKRTNSSKSTSYSIENDEENISKRLLSRRASARYQHSYIPKPKIVIDENEQESSTNTKDQDPGIWLLPILCYTLQVDNILDAQEWLVNASSTEKRLAMELISRTMQDMKYHENEYLSDLSTCDQSSSVSNFNNVYWPYKFWQHQQQSKLPVDNNDTCERATSPVRILTPAKRLPTPSVLNRSIQSSHSSSRLNSDCQSRRSYRVTTSRSTSTDNDHRTVSANFRGKTPLI